MNVPHSVLLNLIRDLTFRYGRPPTAEESEAFIFGDAETRRQAWNKEVSPPSETKQIVENEIETALQQLVDHLSGSDISNEGNTRGDEGSESPTAEGSGVDDTHDVDTPAPAGGELYSPETPVDDEPPSGETP